MLETHPDRQVGFWCSISRCFLDGDGGGTCVAIFVLRLVIKLGKIIKVKDFRGHPHFSNN
jgi:hypothetical protein